MNVAPKICPIMTRPVMIPSDRTGSVTTHYVSCMKENCAMWVGDTMNGRCGMSRITDAEAMKLAMEGAK